MTNSWTDIKNTDLVVIMGGNAAEAHPCGFKWVTEAKANRGAKLIVVDPRFTRSASVADFYAPIRQGTDIAFLLGVINYCIQNDKVQWDYVKAFTNAPSSGEGRLRLSRTACSPAMTKQQRDYNRSTWDYEIGDDGFVGRRRDAAESALRLEPAEGSTSRIYTPEMVERICGTPKDKFLKICEMIARMLGADKTMTSMYALGWTQHSKGSQNIRAMAMLQLILGNIGVRGGGMNALARSLQHPGADRHRPDVEPDPGLSDDPDREGGRLRHLHVDARLQAAAAEPDELLAELQEVLRQLPEVDVGRRRRRRRTTSPMTSCRSSTCRPTTCCAPSS